MTDAKLRYRVADGGAWFLVIDRKAPRHHDVKGSHRSRHQAETHARALNTRTER